MFLHPPQDAVVAFFRAMTVDGAATQAPGVAGADAHATGIAGNPQRWEPKPPARHHGLWFIWL
jgi:hypothetical protein